MDGKESAPGAPGLKRTSVLPGRICLGIGLFLLFVWMLLAALYVVGTDDGLYYQLQMRAGILPAAGVEETELKALDRALAAYLSGERNALAAADAFNATELAHMDDCFALFVLLRRALLSLGAAALLLLAGAALFLRRRFFREGARCGLMAAGVLAALLLALGAWAAIDFDRLFTAFHRLLFSNDLWLLDPATDLLIRICPESMFSSMFVRIVLAGLGGTLLSLMILLAGARLRREK